MSVPTTTRARILEAMRVRLAGIRRVNGYATDAGDRLSIGAVFFGADDDLALALIPGDSKKVGSRQLRKKARTLELQIVAMAATDDRDAWMRVEALIGDIKRAVETDDAELGGLLTSPLEDGEELALSSGEGGESFGTSVFYIATYIEGWGHP